MITELRVKNFKCLKDVSLRLSPLTILIGKNDTGKSSVLDALDTLAKATRFHTIRDAFKPPRELSRVLWCGNREESLSFEVVVEPDGRNQLPGRLTYSLSVRDTHGHPEVHREQLECASGQGEPEAVPLVAFTREGHGDTVELPTFKEGGGQCGVRANGDQTMLGAYRARSPADSPRVRAMFRAISATEKYRFDPSHLAIPTPLPARGSPALSYTGRGLAGVVDHILSMDRKAFGSLESELRTMVPTIKEIHTPNAPVQHRQAGEVGGEALVYKLASTDYSVPAALVSEGVLLVTAYLALVHSPNPPSTILLEEPENAIHPRQLQRVIDHLRRLTSPDRAGGPVQVVATTHSPYLLDFTRPEEVIALGRKASGETVACLLSDLPGVQQRLDHGMTLGELWFNVGEDELFGDLLD